LIADIYPMYICGSLVFVTKFQIRYFTMGARDWNEHVDSSWVCFYLLFFYS